MQSAFGAGKAPASYWVVTVLGLLWNCFGAYDYVMTRTRNPDYLQQLGPNSTDMLAWIDAMPLWAQLGWGLGVWGSFVGSVLMVRRSRHAVSAFLISFVGALASFVHQFTATPPALNTTMNKVIPVVILAVILFLWAYCRSERAKGTLR